MTTRNWGRSQVLTWLSTLGSLADGATLVDVLTDPANEEGNETFLYLNQERARRQLEQAKREREQR